MHSPFQHAVRLGDAVTLTILAVKTWYPASLPVGLVAGACAVMGLAHLVLAIQGFRSHRRGKTEEAQTRTP